LRHRSRSSIRSHHSAIEGRLWISIKRRVALRALQQKEACEGLCMKAPDAAAACLNAWRAYDLSQCKPLGFDLVGWAGILAVLGPALFLIVRVILRRRFAASSDKRLRGTLWKSRFRQLCGAIRHLLDENGRIFREFGPNSGAGGPARVVRQNLGVWRQMMPVIVENNACIRNLINSNKDAIPPRYLDVFEAWINHIDAFEAHAQDPLADYRHHQFPREVVEIVQRNA
jgi:hypothetical protein